MSDLKPIKPIDRMPRYERYKESGVEWIGKVPEHWDIKRLGVLLSPVSIKNSPNLPLLSITREKGVIRRDINSQEENHNFIPEDLSNYKLLAKGQFGMNKMKAWQGSYGVSPYTGIVSPAYYIFAFAERIDSDFFDLAIRSRLYISFFGQASDGVRIGQWDLSKMRMKNIPFLIPPVREQAVITNYLNCKTLKIDQAIAIKEKQINLLKERKQILIQEAVTKGLDPNIPMRDSGVKWIGEIPEQWGIVTLKRVVEFIQTGPFGAELHAHDYIENGTPLINPKHITEDEIIPDHSCTVDKSTKERLKKYVVTQNDIILARRGQLGRSAVITEKEEGWLCGTGSIAIRLKKGTFHSYFLFRLISGGGIIEILRLDSVGSTMENINSSIVGNLILPIPPYKEQKAIVSHIQTQSLKIDKAITLQQQMIEKLKEYKATLINSAVTGKIKVSERQKEVA